MAVEFWFVKQMHSLFKLSLEFLPEKKQISSEFLNNSDFKIASPYIKYVQIE